MKSTKIYGFNFTIRGVLIIGFLLRCLLTSVMLAINHTSGAYTPDTESYLITAKKLIESGQFATGVQPEIFRTPGYPLLLIPGILLGQQELVAIFIQILLSCFTIFLIYKIALAIWGESKIATFCALLYAVEPVSILWLTLLMPETLFTALITLFIYLLIKYFTERSCKYLLCAAISLVASIYVRPIGYYLPLIIAAILLIDSLTKIQKNKILIIHACVFFIVTMGSVGIWQVRNYVKTGYSGFAAVSDYNLYCYNGLSVIAKQKNIAFEKMAEQLGCNSRAKYLKLNPEQQEWSQSQIYRYMGKEGKKMIFSHTWEASIVHLEGTLRTLIETPAKLYLKRFTRQRNPALSLSSQIPKLLTGQTTWTAIFSNFHLSPLVFFTDLSLLLISGVYLLGVTATLLSNNFLKNRAIIALVSIVAYFLALSGGVAGGYRFRLAIMPIICLLAGYGLWLIVDKIKPRNIHE
ncbi:MULTISPECIES: ArnT family glycosyltransferase [unclassified Microcoleus]|uniref:ArnT family glycosyltransferase n=1 Tax=unclassified Microcoleus TaxID=2642155 RepID=UPI002FD55A6C